MKSVALACGDEDALPPGFICFVTDGGKHGNEGSIGACFVRSDTKTMGKTKDTVTLAIRKYSIDARKERCRGHISQIANMYVVYSGREALKLEKYKRKRFPRNKQR